MCKLTLTFRSVFPGTDTRHCIAHTQIQIAHRDHVIDDNFSYVWQNWKGLSLHHGVVWSCSLQLYQLSEWTWTWLWHWISQFPDSKGFSWELSWELRVISYRWLWQFPICSIWTEFQNLPLQDGSGCESCTGIRIWVLAQLPWLCNTIFPSPSLSSAGKKLHSVPSHSVLVLQQLKFLQYVITKPMWPNTMKLISIVVFHSLLPFILLYCPQAHTILLLRDR